jgi:hypothetical protein
MGGASDAKAKPIPNGNAINDTTNPEKIFLGSAAINDFMFLEFVNV